MNRTYCNTEFFIYFMFHSQKHLACQTGFEKIVSLLIERNAEIDAKDGYDKMPIHFAGIYMLHFINLTNVRLLSFEFTLQHIMAISRSSICCWKSTRKGILISSIPQTKQEWIYFTSQLWIGIRAIPKWSELYWKRKSM